MKEKKLAEKETYQISTTISEAVYQHLKKAIIVGKLKPAERLQERGVAKLFNVSTTPVREAFRRLAAEKYLTINAQKEVIVASLSKEEVDELFEVIRALDIMATRKALQRVDEKDIAELRALTDKLSAYYKQKKYRLYLKTNLRFHEYLWKICGNKFLYQSLSDLSKKIAIFINPISLYEENKTFLKKSHSEHVKLMEAIEQRNFSEVEKFIAWHWGEES